MRKLTTDEFINKAKSVHGEKYDYSKVVYTKSREKVEIMCKEHGSFWQTANDHLSGKGCSKCAGNMIKTTNEVVEDFVEVHDDKYDYSKVCYTGVFNKVEIVCEEHGSFWQTPDNHLAGKGCPKCKNVVISKSKRNSFDEFVRKSRILHGEKYDYINVDVRHKKVEIICPIHGTFVQDKSSHLLGYGCWDCGVDKRADNNSKDIYHFLEKAKVVHGDKYDYSKVVYIRSHSNVEIICRKHGSFFQSPNSHLSGACCPKCAKLISKGELKLLEFIKNVLIDKYGSLPEIITNKSPTFFPNKQHLDIYIPSLNIAFEYNGEYWHSKEKRKDEMYHQNKSNWCSDAGVELIHIWESDWKNDKENMKCLVEKFLILV